MSASLFQKLRWGAARHDGMSVDLTPQECRAALDLIEPQSECRPLLDERTVSAEHDEPMGVPA